MPRLDYRLTLTDALSPEGRTLALLLLEAVNPVRVKLGLLPLRERDLVLLLKRVRTQGEGS